MNTHRNVCVCVLSFNALVDVTSMTDLFAHTRRFNWQDPPTLFGQFGSSSQMIIEIGENLDNDGHGQADHDHARDHARAAE